MVYRRHPWFQAQLPAYLQLSARQQIERTQAIDESTLKKVVQVHLYISYDHRATIKR